MSHKTLIKFCPHGVNEKVFFPITNEMPEYLTLQEMKKQLFGEKEYDFVTIWNSRNIARKCPSSVLESWKLFVDNLSEEEASKTCLIMHTQPMDENGTNLYAVHEMLFGNNKKYNVIFSEQRLTPEQMNLLYNCADICMLISSNEGWGLSLTEARMCGLPIIANVQGGMQDQMRFEDENENWIKFTKEFPTNHRGKYQDWGNWAYPVFPSNITLVGSIPTPYIYDERVQPIDVANQLLQAHNDKLYFPEEYKEKCLAAREWVISDESMQSATWMCKNIINGINETFDVFTPREKYELIKVETPNQPKHYIND